MLYTKPMSKEILHSTLIVITLTLSFIFSKTPFAIYDLQISALLFILLQLSKRFFSKDKHRLADSMIYTFIIFTIVNTSGGISSPLFFLTYFLLFSLSLLLEPVVSITTTMVLVFFSLLSLSQPFTASQLLPIISLIILTPFAIFLGQESFKEKKEKEKNALLKKSLVDNKEKAFLFLSLIIKNHVRNINQAADNFLGDHQLDIIKKNAKRMEKLIDEYEKHEA